MTFIFSQTRELAQWLANQLGIERSRWRYLNSTRDFDGCEHVTVIEYIPYRHPHYHELCDYIRTLGSQHVRLLQVQDGNR